MVDWRGFYQPSSNIDSCFSMLLFVSSWFLEILTICYFCSLQYAQTISLLAAKARSVVRDLDPQDNLTFLRIRSRKHEILVAPDKEFLLIVIQDPTAGQKR